MLGGGAGMLKSSPNEQTKDVSLGPRKRNRTFVKSLMIAITATALGSILGLLLGKAHESDDLISSATVGSIFGAFVGVIVAVLFASLPQFRELRNRSKMRTLISFTGLAALAGALILLPFSNGVAMALYVAVEGAIAGAVFGVLLGLLVTVIWRK
jgi:membrane associated rhomboid family serine protease